MFQRRRARARFLLRGFTCSCCGGSAVNSFWKTAKIFGLSGDVCTRHLRMRVRGERKSEDIVALHTHNFTRSLSLLLFQTTIHTHTHPHTYTHTHTNTHKYTHTHTNTYTQTRTHKHTQTNTHRQIGRAHV